MRKDGWNVLDKKEVMDLKLVKYSAEELLFVWICIIKVSKYVLIYRRRQKISLMNVFLQAMRYPLNAHRKELAAAEGAREREKELAKEIQEGELDDEDLGGDF
jgi:hypothetical protein